MHSLLHSQLENQRDIYAKMKIEGRKDLVALLVLKRIEKEIKILERKVDNAEETRQIRRKESPKHGPSRKMPHFFKEIFRRNWIIYGSYCDAMCRRVRSFVLQAQAGAK